MKVMIGSLVLSMPTIWIIAVIVFAVVGLMNWALNRLGRSGQDQVNLFSGKEL